MQKIEKIAHNCFESCKGYYFKLDKGMTIKIQLTTVFLGFAANYSRSVAQLARASVSKTEGCGFETLHSCQSIMSGYT